MNADEIIKMLPDIDPATIYRGLKVLSAEKLIREVGIEKTRANYELNQGNHQYFKCSLCGEVYRIYDFRAEITQEMKKLGLSIDSYELIIRGKCKKCKEEELSLD